MKKTFKLLALILSVIMFIEVVPVGALDGMINGTEEETEETLYEEELPEYTEPEEILSDETSQNIEENKEDSYILSEFTSERLSDVKKFRMSDGTTASVSYPIDVHFVNENGEYVQIDNSPEDGFDEEDEVIDATKDNVFEVKFMKESKEDKIYTLTYRDTRIKVSISGGAPSEVENVTLENKEPGVFDVANITGSYQYTDILDNTDIRYTVVSKDLKENIILKDRVEFDSIEYVYETDSGIEFVQIDEQTVEIRREDEIIAEIKAPSMWDSKGEFCCGVSLTLGETNEGSTAITLSWDDEWANDEERVYPVTVDPYIITKVNYVGATDIVDDVYAVENNPTSTQYSYYEMMGVGHSSYHGRVRSVIKIAFESNVPKNANIVSANLNLIPFVFSPGLNGDFPSETYINLYKMTSSWNESSFCWNTFWSSNPSNGFDSKVVDYVHIENFNPYNLSSIPVYSWDISKIAREWIEGASPNYGVMLAYNDETMSGVTYLASADWIYASGYASDAARPNLTIYYLDTNGLEGYYDTVSASAGRAGAAYVNKMTGNLTAINNILSLGSGPAPINLSLVYNSNDSSETDAFPLGKGWRINYSQSIELTDQTFVDTGRRYFKYVDADGTAHYFLENTANGYNSTDEVDEKNKLTYNSSTYEFTLSSDNSGTKLKFGKSGSSWYLNSIIDEYGNSITLTHGNTYPDIVTKIESSDGYTVNLNYNSYNYLTSVSYTDVTSKSIILSYTGTVVKSVYYEDGKTVNYGYVSGTHRLNKMTDTDGYSLEFTYTGGSGNIPLRVSGITEKGSNGTVRNQATMVYGLRSMTLTDVTNGRTYLNTFTSGGTTLSTVDVTEDTNDAYAMYYEYNNGSSDVKNKDNLTFVSQTQKSTVNLLKNHGFEDTSGTATSFSIWGNNGNSTSSRVFTSEKKHSGSYSVKVTKDDNCSRVLFFLQANLTANKEYTLSAYVNTYGLPQNGTGGASLFINRYSFSKESEVLSGNGIDEWRRLTYTFTVPETNTFSLCLSLKGSSGYAYFDDIQLEEGGLSEYNLIENAGFTDSRCWVANGQGNYESSVGFGSSRAMRLTGNPATTTNAQQNVGAAGTSGDVYVVSALAKAYSVPSENCDFSVSVKFMNGTTLVNEEKVKFNTETAEWQKAAGQVIAGGTYNKIQIQLNYQHSANVAYFDNISLIKDYFGNTYTYDSKGNITSTKDLASTEENTFTYDGNSRLIQQTNITGSNITYTYNGTKVHQLDSVTASGVTTSFSYDPFGNAMYSTASNSGGTKTVSSGAAYNSKGEVTATTDSLGNTTSYLYTEGLLKEMTDASGAKVVNEYNSSRLATSSKFVKDSTQRTVGYTYDTNNYLTGITAPGGTTYGFTYDEFGRKLSTSVGQTTMTTNTYNSKGLLSGTTYMTQNPVTYSYTYDVFNRLKSVSVGANEKVTYSYDGKGRVSEVNDISSGTTTKTEYDLLDRTSKVSVIKNNDVIQTSSVRYDNKNRVEGIDYAYSGDVKSTDYVYGNSNQQQEPSVIYGVELNDSSALTYTYDDLFRTTKKTIAGASNFETEYTYSGGIKFGDGMYARSNYEECVTLGDFNGDGFDDIAAIYRYSSTHCKIFVWLADGSGGYQNPRVAFENDSDNDPYDASKIKGRICAGDFDGNGNDDIAVFYDLGSNNIALHVFASDGTNFTKYVTITTPAGDFYPTAITYRVTAGDYDGDGKDEIAAMYDCGNSHSMIFIFTLIVDGNNYTSSCISWYDSGVGNYDANAVTGRFISGNFIAEGSGAQKDEIASLYDNGNGTVKLQVFKKDGTNSAFVIDSRQYQSVSGEFSSSSFTGTMVSGNFAGDESDDVAAVYAYANNAKVFVFESTSNLFNDGWVTVHNGKGSYLAPNLKYSVFGANVTSGGYDEIVSLYKQTSRESSIYKFEANSSGTFYLYNNLWNSQIYELSDTASTSTRVASETIGDDVYTYTYDVLGNITEIKKNGNAYRSYKYDALGELIREDNKDSNKTYIYKYNDSGNITSHKEYIYISPGNDVVGYGDTTSINYYSNGWKDRIFHIDYARCYYDDIGNPYIYLDNELEWSDGRLLTEFYDAFTDDVTEYTYNSNGIRTSKTYNNYEDQYVITHEYLLDGSKIICEKINCNDSDPANDILLHFYYDASGNIFAFEYDDDMYYYVRNILGEILGIIDTGGSYVVKYTYDAWGKPLSITDGAGIDVSDNSSHIANINPFRYKGYYYDTETGFYYLQSRYYDPFVGRFINADDPECLGANGDFLSFNLFAYCGNNPIRRADEAGYGWFDWVVGAVAAIAAVAVTAVTFGAAAPAAVCTLTSVGMYIGASYTVASTVATAAVTTTSLVTSLYVGDAVYSQVTGESYLMDTVFHGNETAYETVGEIATIASAGMFEMASQSPGICFVAGTMISTSEGLISIEDIEIGDLVWSWDENTGNVALKPVINTYVNETYELINMSVGREWISCTPQHPFYSPVNGWTAAVQLRAGDILLQQNGEYVVVEKIQHELLESPVSVFNLNVSDYHSYCISNYFVVVPNSCKSGFKHKTAQAIEKMLGVENGYFHDYIKPHIFKDINSSILKQVGKNPDIYIDSDGYIMLGSRTNKNISKVTNLNIYDYLP